MKKSTQWAVYLLLPITILLAAAFLLWEPICYFALRQVAGHYAGRAGIVLDIGEIAGSPLSNTTITGLSLRPAAGEPQTYKFKAEAITCTYDLWDLKKGLDPFLNGLSCMAAGPGFSYDLRVETTAGMEPDESVFLVPAVLPMLDVENGTAILTSEEGVAEMQGINGSLRSAPAGIHELQMEVDRLRFSQEGAVRIDTGFTAFLRYADAKLSIVSFEVGEEQIAAAGFIDLARVEEEYTGFALDVLFGDSKLQISGDLDSQALRSHVRTGNFDIGELQKRMGGVGWDISGRIRGEAQLAYDLEAEADYNGSFGFNVQECRVHGVAISSLFVEGSLADGVLQVAKAEAATSGNHVALRNVSVPMKLVQGGEVFSILAGTQAEFGAEVNDWASLQELFALEDDLLSEELAPRSLSLTGRLADGILRVAEAEAATSNNSVALRNVSVPMHLVQGGEVFTILGGMQAEFGAEVNDWASLQKLFALEEDLLPEGLPQYTLTLEGSLAEGILRVAEAEAATADNHVTLRNVSVPMHLVQGGEVFTILAGMQAEFGAEINDWASLQELFASEEDLLPEGFVPHSLSLAGKLADGVLYLDKARGDAADLNLEIDQGEIPVPAGAEGFASVPVSLTAKIESANLQEITRLFTETAVSGSAAADMTITGSTRDFRAVIKLAGEDLSFKKVQLGSLALQGDIQFLQENPGEIKDIRFTVREFNGTNDFGSLALLAPAEGSWQPGSFTASGAFRVDGDGEVAIKIDQSAKQDLAAEISTRGLNSGGWLGAFLAGGYFFHDADIEAVFVGLPKHPQVRLAGSVDEVGWEGMPFPLAGRFGLQYSPKGIEISEFVWESSNGNELTLAGFLPYDPMAPEPFLAGELTLDGHIEFTALEDIRVFLEPLGIRKGSVALDIGLTGTWKQPLGSVQLKAAGVEVPDILKEYFDAPLDVTGELAAEPGLIVLRSARIVSGSYESQAAGSWQHGYTFAEFLQKRWDDLQGEVSFDAALELKDLNFLKKKLAWVRRIDGDTQVKIHVEGPVSELSFKGSFFLKEGELSHTINLPMLTALNLEGEFDTNSLTITSMEGEVGGSPVSMNGRVSRAPEGIDVNLQLDGKNVLLLRNNDMLLRGDVHLKASGPFERLVINGTTGLTGGYYTKNIDFLGKIGTTTAPVSEGGTFLFSFEEQPLKNAVLDIRITTIEPFRIRNNLVRGSLRPELSLRGTGELPYLVGEIYIDPSRVLLPSGRLQIQTGLVRFLKSDPDRPRLDLVGSSKVMGYDINVVMQGPIEEPVYTLSSSPALPNDELLLLLLTGQPPKDEEIVDPGKLGRGATNVVVYLSRDFLSKWLEDESGASDESILDRFELDYGRAVTKSGEQTIESTFRLSEQASGKNRIYYLSGEKDRYDAYNYGLKVVFHFD
jgi:hypothetical protein